MGIEYCKLLCRAELHNILCCVLCCVVLCSLFHFVLHVLCFVVMCCVALCYALLYPKETFSLDSADVFNSVYIALTSYSRLSSRVLTSASRLPSLFSNLRSMAWEVCDAWYSKDRMLALLSVCVDERKRV